MSPLLQGFTISLTIAQQRAQCGLMGANNCKCSWEQRLSCLLKHAGIRVHLFDNLSLHRQVI
jgi:hypothetical protein